MATGRLFAPNPILPVSPLYPGFESVISAVVSVSGLSIFQAGILVVGMAKLLGALVLFYLYETLLSGSSRIASVGVLLYASNPHYALFDSQFAYESLGVPLIAFALFAICRRTGVPTDGRWTLLLICLLGILGQSSVYASCELAFPAGHPRHVVDCFGLRQVRGMAIWPAFRVHHVHTRRDCALVPRLWRSVRSLTW